MTNKEPGYVYIFTNDSFRDGWIKIGKTKDIDKRLNDLDNTSCPLPFDVYATLKTCRYEDAETFVHDYISHFNHNLRVRPNREYFKVQPKEALEVFFQVKRLMNEPDSEIRIFKEKDSKFIKQMERKYHIESKSGNEKPSITTIKHSSGNVSTPEDRETYTWLITYDPDYFDVAECFAKYHQVYFKHINNKKNVRKGDYVYLYGSSSKSSNGTIRFLAEVVESNLPYSPEMDSEDDLKKKEDKHNKEELSYFLLRPIGETKSRALNYSELKKRGFLGERVNTMNLSKKKYKEFLEYIDENFEETSSVEPATVITQKAKPKKQKRSKKEGRRPHYKHYMAGLEGGEELIFDPTGVKVKAIGENMVEYNNRTLSLTAFCKEFMPEDKRIPAGTYQGPAYFSYNGKTLWELRLEREK